MKVDIKSSLGVSSWHSNSVSITWNWIQVDKILLWCCYSVQREIFMVSLNNRITEIHHIGTMNIITYSNIYTALNEIILLTVHEIYLSVFWIIWNTSTGISNYSANQRGRSGQNLLSCKESAVMVQLITSLGRVQLAHNTNAFSPPLSISFTHTHTHTHTQAEQQQQFLCKHACAWNLILDSD